MRDNVRHLLRSPLTEGEIRLAPGEYEGPFLIDRPVRLVGTGDYPEAMTLWTRRGPAVIVRSPGVELINLQVELTCSAEVRQHDPVIWYAPGCAPEVSRAQICGRMESMGAMQHGKGWNLPDLIDLGELRAKYPVSLSLVVQSPGPARLWGELTDLMVSPSLLPEGGEHWVQLGFPADKLIRDTLLAGQLVIESAGETRAVWIIGRVLDEELKDWMRERLVLIGRSGRRYGFEPGVVLGREQFAGEPGAELLGERAALVTKEPGGMWSLLQPLATATPLRLNGQPLGVGRRRLLRGGETIEVGEFRLTVEAKNTHLPVQAEGLLDLGRLSARVGAPSPTVQVQIEPGQRHWEGSVRSLVPWLRVPRPDVKGTGGQTVPVLLELGAELFQGGARVLRQPGALAVVGAKESWLIGVQLEVDLAPALTVEPAELDFGAVVSSRPVVYRSLRLRNTGTAPWQGHVICGVPWLSVDRQEVQCASGEVVELTLALTEALETLPEGVTALPAALVIEGSGSRRIVAVRLERVIPVVRLDFSPFKLDWGPVADWKAAAPQIVWARNSGNQEWQGTASCTVNWAVVEAAEVRCPAGGAAAVTVRLTNAVSALPAGEATGLLQLAGEGLNFDLPMRLHLEAPLVEVEPAVLDWVLDDRTALPGGVLRVRNCGGVPWQGRLQSAVPWLRLESETVLCPAGGETTVKVALTSQVNDFFRIPRQVVVDDALELSGPGVAVRVELRLDVRSVGLSRVVSSPAIETGPETTAIPSRQLPRIDFGTLDEVLDSWPACSWRWRNSSRQPVQGTVRSTLPWLEVEPAAFSAQPNEEVAFTARLTEKLLGLRPKRYTVTDGIVLEAGGEAYYGPVQLTLVSTVSFAARTAVGPLIESVAVPAVTKPEVLPVWRIDFGRAEAAELAGMQRELLLEPPFARPVEGTVRSTLPWLAVEPTHFSWRPGEFLLLRVSLTKDATRLRFKTYEISDALDIEGGGQRFKVGVSLEVGATVSAAALLPEGLSLDFGQVAEGRWVPVTRELRWVHRQAHPLMGRVESTLPWIDVAPEQFTAQPGQEIVLTARLTEKAAKLRSKRYELEDGLILRCGEQQQRVGVVLNVGGGQSVPVVAAPVLPEVADGLRVEPAVLDWGRVNDWRGALPVVSLTVTNGRQEAWRGTAHSTLPWLEVEPGTFTCPAGGRVTLRVRLTEAGARLRRGKRYQVADGVGIEVEGQTVWVEVAVEIL